MGLRFRWDFEFTLSGVNTVGETWPRPQVDSGEKPSVIGTAKWQRASACWGLEEALSLGAC